MQTKNVNVQPSVAKNEKNVVAAAKNAASQNSSAGNGPILNGQSGNGPLLNGQSGNGPLLNGQSGNGPLLNGQSGNSQSGNGPLLNGQSRNGPLLNGQSGNSQSGNGPMLNGQSGNGPLLNGQSGNGPLLNGQTGNSQSGNGPMLNGHSGNGPLLNGQSGNGPLLNSQSGNGPMLNGQSGNGPMLNGTELSSINHRSSINSESNKIISTSTNMKPQTSSPYKGLPSNSAIYLPMKSPYMHLPVTSGHHHSSPVTSGHPHTSGTSAGYPQTSQYQELPSISSPYQPPPLPPRLRSQRSDLLMVAHATPAAGSVHSVYKPVPPPKPFSGTASGNSTTEDQDSTTQQSSAAALREQLAAITGVGVPVSGGLVNGVSGPPPLLSHILVTDQGHFHTHSTKFPIQVKEGPTSIQYGTRPSIPAPGNSRSSTLGRGVRGPSAGLSGMGVSKGSTLPRAGVPSLAPPTATTPVINNHQSHSSGGVTGGVDDKDQLVDSERHIRFLEGIDNPGLLDDTHMQNYRAQGGVTHIPPSHIPPEGTLAGALPSRPFESPFMQRPQYRTPSDQQQHPSSQQFSGSSQQNLTSQQFSGSSQQNLSSQQYSGSSQSHGVNSQGHPGPSSHHHPPSSQLYSSPSQHFTRETWMRTSQEQYNGSVELHPPKSHMYMNGHSTHSHIGLPTPHSHIPTHPDTSQHTHHHLINSYQEQTHNGNSHTTENNANNAQDQQDPRKDDKWGSLTRGLAARKYQHLKEKLSNKFSKDKGDERTDNKNISSQGTNTQNTNENKQNEGGNEASGETGRNKNMNTSFRRAVHQETSLTNGPGLPNGLQNGLPNGLPPQYPRNQDHSKHNHPQQPSSSPQILRSHHDPLGRGLGNRRSGSYHHLAQVGQIRQEPHLSWHPHHYSVDNLAHSHALPSDHTYPGTSVSGTRGQPAGGEGGGSGGSDSGRGTAGSRGEGRIPNPLDTSLDSNISNKQNNQSHSSGNDSEWVDLTDAELKLIMKKGNDGAKTRDPGGGGSKLVRRESLAATPPLPPLSPEGTPEPSPQPTPPRHRKYSLSYSSSGLNKPDLLEAAGNKRGGDGGGGGGGGGDRGGGGGDGSAQNSSQSTPRRSTAPQHHTSHQGKSTVNQRSQATVGPSSWHHRKEEERQRAALSYDNHNKNKSRINIDAALGELDAGDITSTTDALDLDSMLDGATEATSDDDDASQSHPDVHLIRKQLEGLEGMYSEVLKLLGGGRRGGVRHMHGLSGGGDLKTSRRRLHGSLSSLPSSIMSSRPGRDKRRVIDDRVRKIGKDGGSRTIHKRFQRLESHVVTLARSVAHLSSEMRTQHLMFQEIENVRAEVAALRTGGSGGGGHSGKSGQGHHVSWESFRAGIPGLSNPGRVKKLTQFFGDEPPLVRIFLRKLGYEKYAPLFEQEKIGMLELPYLTEERLQKIGIPMGPRLRILQEAQGPIRKEGNLSVYVV